MFSNGAGGGAAVHGADGEGERSDVVDSLQKRFNREVGFLPMCALEGHLKRNRISIGFENDEPAGYILVKENYLRDPEHAVLYQCAIEYDARRHLLGSALLEHAISLCPRRTRVASAWVAQDIDANFFWEACGFAPVAARKGSVSHRRVHIFWQKVLGTGSALRHGSGPGGRGQKGDALSKIPEATRGGLMREKRAVIRIDANDEGWKDLSPEDFPEVEDEEKTLTPHPSPRGRGGQEEKVSIQDARRAFVYGAQDWMYVIINGVGRYLRVMHEIEVPEFVDIVPQAVLSIPSSQIPGVVTNAKTSERRNAKTKKKRAA